MALTEVVTDDKRERKRETLVNTAYTTNYGPVGWINQKWKGLWRKRKVRTCRLRSWHFIHSKKSGNTRGWRIKLKWQSSSSCAMEIHSFFFSFSCLLKLIMVMPYLALNCYCLTWWIQVKFEFAQVCVYFHFLTDKKTTLEVN